MLLLYLPFSSNGVDTFPIHSTRAFLRAGSQSDLSSFPALAMLTLPEVSVTIHEC